MLGGSWWVTDVMESRGLPFLVSWVVWVLGSISLHELGHGWAALRRGDRTPVETGHMTWNPVVHMGVPSLIMFGIIGIAWGQMPVSPSRMRGRYADLFVAAAGPLMNLSLAVAAVVLGGAWVAFGAGISPHESFYLNVANFFYLGAALNIVLIVLNLMPVPPLDGSRILADLSPAYARFIATEHAPIVGLMVLLGVFFLAGDVLWGIGFGGADLGLFAVADLLGGGADTPDPL